MGQGRSWSLQVGRRDWCDRCMEYWGQKDQNSTGKDSVEADSRISFQRQAGEENCGNRAVK